MRIFSRAPMGATRSDDGRRLPSSTLRRASAAFGQDLSHVRVTTGRASGGPGTLAEAWGDRIILDHSLDDQPPLVRDFVLAHELAHVAQQAAATRAAGTPFNPAKVRLHEQAHLEANANAAAMAMLSGQSTSVTAAPLALSRCMVPAGTMITPAHFRFQTIVGLPRDGSPGGWQAAAIRARMSKDVGGRPYGSVFCIFEVGVPLRNYLGPVSPQAAATAAAAAANSAAYTVLSDGTPASAAHCTQFKRLMEIELQAVIPGARVGAHVSRIPLVDFPP